MQIRQLTVNFMLCTVATIIIFHPKAINLIMPTSVQDLMILATAIYIYN